MMNCTNAQQALFLMQTGELSVAQQSTLHEHLSSCATCRAYRADLTRMLIATRETPLEKNVSEFTMRKIELAAKRNLHPAGERQVGGSLIEMWRPALVAGAAAALVLLLAITYIRRDAAQIALAPDPAMGTDEIPAELLAWDPPLEDEFESLTTLLAMSVGDDVTQDPADSLDTLAEELIELESWNI